MNNRQLHWILLPCLLVFSTIKTVAYELRDYELERLDDAISVVMDDYRLWNDPTLPRGLPLFTDKFDAYYHGFYVAPYPDVFTDIKEAGPWFVSDDEIVKLLLEAGDSPGKNENRLLLKIPQSSIEPYWIPVIEVDWDIDDWEKFRNFIYQSYNIVFARLVEDRNADRARKELGIERTVYFKYAYDYSMIEAAGFFGDAEIINKAIEPMMNRLTKMVESLYEQQLGEFENPFFKKYTLEFESYRIEKIGKKQMEINFQLYEIIRKRKAGNLLQSQSKYNYNFAKLMNDKQYNKISRGFVVLVYGGEDPWAPGRLGSGTKKYFEGLDRHIILYYDKLFSDPKINWPYPEIHISEVESSDNPEYIFDIVLAHEAGHLVDYQGDASEEEFRKKNYSNHYKTNMAKSKAFGVFPDGIHSQFTDNLMSSSGVSIPWIRDKQIYVDRQWRERMLTYAIEYGAGGKKYGEIYNKFNKELHNKIKSAYPK